MNNYQILHLLIGFMGDPNGQLNALENSTVLETKIFSLKM